MKGFLKFCRGLFLGLWNVERTLGVIGPCFCLPFLVVFMVVLGELGVLDASIHLLCGFLVE